MVEVVVMNVLGMEFCVRGAVLACWFEVVFHRSTIRQKQD